MAFPKTYTVDDIANLLIVELFGEDKVKRIYTGGERGWKGDVRYMNLDITKLSSLGWVPEVSLAEGIKRYVEWIRISKELKVNIH